MRDLGMTCAAVTLHESQGAEERTEAEAGPSNAAAVGRGEEASGGSGAGGREGGMAGVRGAKKGASGANKASGATGAGAGSAGAAARRRGSGRAQHRSEAVRGAVREAMGRANTLGEASTGEGG